MAALKGAAAVNGPWVLVGRPLITVYGDTIENYQFIHLDGPLAAAGHEQQPRSPVPVRPHGRSSPAAGLAPVVSRSRAGGPPGALNPGTGTTGDTYEHANSAFLVDRGAIRGRYYLVYADAPDHTSFGGQGRNRLGIARSTDLMQWSVPSG